MATLEIDFNCMCLIVPDPKEPGADTGTVHVLMPCTHHGDAANLHVAQMDYRDAQGNERVVRLEGWGLELGDPQNPTAQVELRLPDGSQETHIVDITERTRSAQHPNGRHVPRTMLARKHPNVVARISLHGGVIKTTYSEWPEWVLGGSKVTMASKLVWRMEVDNGQMAWTSFNGTGQPPLGSLGQVKPEDSDQVYKLHVHHVATKAIDDQTGLPRPHALDADDIRNHFGMFYKLLGEDPRHDLLPALHPEDVAIINHPGFGGTPGWGCKLGLARAER